MTRTGVALMLIWLFSLGMGVWQVVLEYQLLHQRRELERRLGVRRSLFQEIVGFIPPVVTIGLACMMILLCAVGAIG